MTLLNKIKDYLSSTGEKPYQLADKAGVPRTIVYRFLNGERGMNLSSAEKILKAINPEESTA